MESGVAFHPRTQQISSGGVELYALRTKKTNPSVVIVKPSGAVAFGTTAHGKEEEDDMEIFNADTFVVVSAPDPNNWTKRSRILFLFLLGVDILFTLYFIGVWIISPERSSLSAIDRFWWEAWVVPVWRILRISIGFFIVLRCWISLLPVFIFLVLIDFIVDVMYLHSTIQLAYYGILALLWYSACIASAYMTPAYIASRSLFY